ncbi:MAG: protein kinase [Planctomycetes bacterium]|nr:protein kinase [Planctomycetota bacterium]
MDPSQRFLALAVQAGLLTPDQAQRLLASATAARRPAWEVAVEVGAVSREAATRLRRAATAAPPASGEDVTATVAPPAAVEARSTRLAALAPASLEVKGELGRGGMGRVLRALDRTIGREVAKKVLLDAAASSQGARARFLTEARVTGQLEHPAIVPVYEVGQEPTGEPYFVMKLVRGRSLADVLRATRDDPAHPNGQLPVLLRQFLKVCDAVAYAHARGVLHRDLKPANVMVGDFGEVLVMDWGLARAPGQADVEAGPGAAGPPPAGQTQDGAVLGTPAYMPPEQAEGRREAVDERSDVYALGAILFELLALRPPFVGATPINIIKQVLVDAPPDPRAVAPRGRAVPRELAAVALKALAKAPAARYPRAVDLAAEVTRFLDGLPVEALPMGPLARALKWAARHAELTAAAVTGLVVTLGVAGVGAAATASKERDRARAAAEARALADAVAAEAQARAAAEGEARAAADERLLAAARRARAQVPYFRVEALARRDLTADQLRTLILAPLEEAVALDPTFTEALLLLGQVRIRLGDRAGAREALMRADETCRVAAGDAERFGLGRGAGSPAALFLLGRMAQLEERLEEARAHYARAAELDPDDMFTRLAQWSLLGREPEAQARRLQLAEELLARFPSAPEAVTAYAESSSWVDDRQASRAVARARLEEVERRLTEGMRALEPEPTIRSAAFGVRSRRGYLRAALGRFEDALEDLRAADELTGRGRRVFVQPITYLEFLLQLGHVLLATGHEAEGLERLEQAARMQPDEYHVDLVRGQHLLSRGDAAGAAAALAAGLRKLDAHAPGQGREWALVASLLVAQHEAGRPAAEALPLARRLLGLPAVPFAPYFPLEDFDARLVRAMGAVRREPAVAAEVDAQLRAGLAQATEQVAARMRAADHEGAVRLASHGLACLDALDDPDPVRRLNLLGARAVARLHLDRPAAAARDLEACLALNDRATPERQRRAAADCLNLAAAHAQLPDGRAAAVAALEEAAALGLDRPDLVRELPALAPLLDDPRVQAALRRMDGR